MKSQNIGPTESVEGLRIWSMLNRIGIQSEKVESFLNNMKSHYVSYYAFKLSYMLILQIGKISEKAKERDDAVVISLPFISAIQ